MERNTYSATGSSIKTGVYKLLNTFSNKVYIGSTSQGFYERKSMHLYELRKNIHSNNYLQNAWNKYGEDNFEFKILEKVKPENCISREQYWMDFYNCCDKSKGYNIKNIAGSSLGYKYTKKQKRNISIGLNHRKCPVYKLSLNGQILKEYESISKASLELNIDNKLIIDSCNNRVSHAKGYTFLYKKDYDSLKCYKKEIKDLYKLKANIIQKDLNNNIIKEWDSLKSVADVNNYNKGTLTSCLRGRMKTAYGFKWDYKFLN